MSWSIEFMPLCHGPFWGDWPRLAPFCSWSILALRRGAVLRLISYALLLLAIANPQLKQEEREPSQRCGCRRRRREPKPGDRGAHASPSKSARTWRRSSKRSQSRYALALDLDLDRQRARRHHALHRSHPGFRRSSRPARGRGHDYRREVHDVPASAAGLGTAPVHALLTGKANSTAGSRS